MSREGKAATAAMRRPEERLVRALLERLRHLVCALHGHDHLRQFERNRMFLKCVSCGYESPGWELSRPRPTVTARGEAARPPRPRLLDVRRIA
jgi:hypothetical protein